MFLNFRMVCSIRFLTSYWLIRLRMPSRWLRVRGYSSRGLEVSATCIFTPMIIRSNSFEKDGSLSFMIELCASCLNSSLHVRMST